VGELTFPIIARHVSEIVTVSEEAIVEAMRITWQRSKLVIEASAAVPLAALLEGALDARGARVGIILSGGNADLDALPW
jgi:threonine dehydratase